MKITKIGNYRGYRHNRYDSYDCSWGVLKGLGASSTADCFADPEDYPDDEFIDRWEGNDPEFSMEEEEFVREILLNLDSPIQPVMDLEIGESVVLREYWGETIPVVFTKRDDGIVVKIAGFEFLCEF